MLGAIDREVNIVIDVISFGDKSIIFITLNVKNTIHIRTSSSSCSSKLLLH